MNPSPTNYIEVNVESSHGYRQERVKIENLKVSGPGEEGGFIEDNKIIDDDDENSFTTEDNEIFQLRTRVEKLEQKVGSLESELRLIRRKVRYIDTSKFTYDMISETVLRVLNDNSWNICKNKARTGSSDDEAGSIYIDGLSVPGSGPDISRSRLKRPKKPVTHNGGKPSKIQPKMEKIKKIETTCNKGSEQSDVSSTHSMSENYLEGTVKEVGIIQKREKPQRKAREKGKDYQELRGRKRDEVWQQFNRAEVSGRQVASCLTCGLNIYPKANLCKKHLRNCSIPVPVL